MGIVFCTIKETTLTAINGNCILLSSLGLSAENISANNELVLKKIRENIIFLVVLGFS